MIPIDVFGSILQIKYLRVSMDLDIDHYSLQDLLKLFQLPEDFTEQQLRNARKRVVAVHPDKSGLDHTYFLFFHKAYTLLNTVFRFKQKAQTRLQETPSFADLMSEMEDTDKTMLAHTFTTNPQFNKEFNQLFETLYTKDEDGHGEWLKSNEDLEVTYDQRKQQSRALTVSSIEAANTPHFSDLKNAYTVDTVIGVSEEDYRSTYKTVEELKQVRAQNIIPLQREEAERKLAQEQERESSAATDRAYRLLQEEQYNRQQQQVFWGKLLQLKH
jgi:hypothetical protein